MQEALVPNLTRRLTQPSWLTNIVLVVLGSVFIALLAQVSVQLGFTPVPITGQTLGVLLLGAAFGARRAAASVLLYLAEGALGAPVFAGGTGGVAVLAGPTAGYLAGFVVAAFVVGYLAEHGFDRRWLPALFAFFVGDVIIFIVGVAWLTVLFGFQTALSGGLLPFIPGEVVKIALAAILLPSAWMLVKRFER
ncbi:MAG: biotin transporter BioY [Chloroflexi bacterium]|nr:MAG: biotin transporter BioY [Chloroflexota bacterium]MBL1194905.1 biotin transporter BioY [Chloroflexota bacterium]NOH12196.1 biotin transporter BioY [Chloroflexota bacterium]